MKLKGYLFIQQGENIIPLDISNTTEFNYKDYEDVRKTLNQIKEITGYLVMLTNRK